MRIACENRPQHLVQHLATLIEWAKLHLPIDRTFPLDQAAAAQAHMRANAHFGKIVLRV